MICLTCAMNALMCQHSIWIKHMRLHLHDMRSMRFSQTGAMQAWRYNGKQSVLLGSVSTTVQALEEGPNSGLHMQLSGGKVRALKAFCHPA